MRHPSALPMASGETHKELVQFADARATVVGRQNWCCLFWLQREEGAGGCGTLNGDRMNQNEGGRDKQPEKERKKERMVRTLFQTDTKTVTRKPLNTNSLIFFTYSSPQLILNRAFLLVFTVITPPYWKRH